MLRAKLYPYKMGSHSAKALAAGLGIKQLKHTGPQVRVVPPQRIINWGASHYERNITYGVPAQLTINPPEKVAIAGNKLTAFRELARDETINLPAWTTDVEVAKSYGVVVCRTVLNGHSGRGIVVAERHEDIVPAPLYTQYIKKISEFRVHVVRGDVIDIQQKRKRTDFEGETNTKIRNHQNGWVYCRENLESPPDLQEQAIKAVTALGLDFGAVDLIYNQRAGKSYVLEVNTAPGLEGTTLEKYVAAFKQLLGA